MCPTLKTKIGNSRMTSHFSRSNLWSYLKESIKASLCIAYQGWNIKKKICETNFGWWPEDAAMLL